MGFLDHNAGKYMLLTPAQRARRLRQDARRQGLERQRAQNRAADQRDYLAARAKHAPEGSLGAQLR